MNFIEQSRAINEDLAVTPQELQVGIRQELDKRLLGEEDAKAAISLGVLTGDNVLLGGAPGSGKTDALKAVPTIIGVSEENYVRIAADKDARPKETTGASIVSVQNGERSVTEYVGQVTAATELILANEINRGSAAVVNTLLEVMENGEIERDGKIIRLVRKIGSISTMNPGDHRNQGTMPLPYAFGSRNSASALMGADAEGLHAGIEKMFVDAWNPQPVAQITTPDNILHMRERFARVDMPQQTVGRFAVQFLPGVLGVLKSMGVEEGFRFARKVHTNARALAALNGESAVDVQDVVRATKFAATGPLIIAARSIEQVKDHLDQIDQLATQKV